MSRFSHYIGKHFVIGLMSLLISLLVLAGCLYAYMMIQLPNVETLKDSKLQIPLRIYTEDGQLIAEYGAMRRDPVSLDKVPKQLLNAIIATEDQRFFENSGVDFIGVLRAGYELIVTGQKTQGASTISMQVARNFFLTPEKTFSRKINEALLALKINNTFSKEKILELYINKIYLGQHAYGVSAAASTYYGKSLDELTLPEMAMIAGLPQMPSRANPITNPAAAKLRRDHVLQRMLEHKYIDQKSYEEAIKAPVATYYHGPRITVDAPHVAEMVRNVLYQQYSEDAYTSGLKVYTTINSRLQDAANEALRNGLVAYEKRHKGYRGPEKNLGQVVPQDLSTWQRALGDAPQTDSFIPAAVLSVKSDATKALLADGTTITLPTPRHNSRPAIQIGDLIRVLEKDGKWTITQIPQVQGAIVSLNPADGAILALNGGFNDSNNGFNRAVQAKRQPGSNFKPFLYTAALAKGLTLATVINDAPLAINDTGDPNNLWRPKNDDGLFHGPTRLRMGLVRSLNLVSIRILQMIGIPYAIDYITQFGFDKDQIPPSLSLALGTALVTPLQMAVGYSTFANGGYRVTPYYIEQIQAADGKILYQTHPPTVLSYAKPGAAPLPQPPEAIAPDVDYLITSAMQDVVRIGTGAAVGRTLKRGDLAGKTGTTNRNMDAWFSGFNTRIETTVWVGYDQQQTLLEWGGQAALPIWVDFMKVALNGMPEEVRPPPADIVSARINPYTGLLAEPNEEDAIFEQFRSDTVPTETSGNEPEGVSDEGNADGALLF